MALSGINRFGVVLLDDIVDAGEGRFQTAFQRPSHRFRLWLRLVARKRPSQEAQAIGVTVDKINQTNRRACFMNLQLLTLLIEYNIGYGKPKQRPSYPVIGCILPTQGSTPSVASFLVNCRFSITIGRSEAPSI